MNEQEFNETLIEGIEGGHWIAVLDKGELRLYHIKHANKDLLRRSLPADDVRQLLASKEAE